MGSYFLGVAAASVRKICLASSALFNLSACVYGWASPIGAALGCVADAAGDNTRSDNTRDLVKAIDNAFEKMLTTSTPSSHRKIIQELRSSDIEINSLRDFIEKTEAYQSQHCTDKDTKEIIERFEMHFKEELSHYPALSRFYILTTGIVTMEQLKQICDILDAENKNINVIQEEVKKTNEFLIKFDRIITLFAREATFVLVAMAVFLVLGVLSNSGFSSFWIVSGLASYSVPSFLIFFLEKSGSISVNLHDLLSTYRHETGYLRWYTLLKFLTTLLLPSLVSTSCFLLITLSISNQADQGFFYAIMAFVCGSLFSKVLKTLSC